MARMNLTDVRKFGERALDRVYGDDVRQPIKTKRLAVLELTRRYSKYEDIVRVSQTMFNVEIHRNKLCLDEGIYISGRSNFVDQCISWLTMVITRIEKDTEEYGNPLGKSKRHGNSNYSSHCSRKIDQVVQVSKGLITYTHDLVSSANAARLVSDAMSIRYYCNHITVLQNKTKYNGQLRYPNSKDGPTKE